MQKIKRSFRLVLITGPEKSDKSLISAGLVATLGGQKNALLISDYTVPKGTPKSPEGLVSLIKLSAASFVVVEGEWAKHATVKVQEMAEQVTEITTAVTRCNSQPVFPIIADEPAPKAKAATSRAVSTKPATTNKTKSK